MKEEDTPVQADQDCAASPLPLRQRTRAATQVSQGERRWLSPERGEAGRSALWSTRHSGGATDLTGHGLSISPYPPRSTWQRALEVERLF